MDNEKTDNNENDFWLSAHLYYHEPWEKFIKKAVSPFIEKMLEECRIKHFFFIRYWEKGPHIRLRFQGNKHELEEKIKPNLIKHFEDYYKEFPSQYQSEKIKEIAKAQHWYPNNSVQFVEYEPEVERYGGLHAISVAEEHFQFSSKAVLAVISDSDIWSYDQAMGTAIRMHLCFAHGAGMSKKEATLFFDSIFKWGSIFDLYKYSKKMPQDEAIKVQKADHDAFEENFKKQKQQLLPFHKTVWEALSNGVTFEQDWMNEWVEETVITKKKLKLLQKENKFYIPATYKENSEINISTARQQLWYVYQSYVHMTNNRLGIMNKDEAFLGYLLKRSLESF